MLKILTLCNVTESYLYLDKCDGRDVHFYLRELRILACARILLRDGRIEMIVIYVNKT